MSEGVQEPGPARVSDDDVWRCTKLVFTASALVFLVTIALGFLNVFTTGALPRWQLLVHLHSGALGWLTLSAFGATVWLFTGRRAVSDTYVARVRWLTRALIVAFVGLIASFGIAYSQGGNTFYLLAAVAPLAALTIWATTVSFLHQLARLPVVTTPHLLTAAGFLSLAIGVTFATVIGVGRAGLLAVPDFASTGHVFGILGYQVLVITGIIEWVVRRGRGGRWTRPGALQVALGLLIGLFTPLAVLLLVAGAPEGPISILFLLGTLVLLIVVGLLFLGRVGHRALRTNPLSSGVDPWIFFATLWLAVNVAWFTLRIPLGEQPWFMPVNAHITFVGIITNLLLGVISVRTRSAGGEYSWVEPAAMWLINGGLVVFVDTRIALGTRHGALVMGTGVLLGAGWALGSLRATPAETEATAQAGVETTD